MTDALAYQSATSEVLSIIDSTSTDLQPVFDMIADRAARLCNAAFGFVLRFDGQTISLTAHHNLDSEMLEALGEVYPMRPTLQGLVGRAILERRVVHIDDILDDADYAYSALQTMLGYRTIVAVPMLHLGEPIGAIALYRRSVDPFSDRQIRLVRTFASQAVIAIQNACLFSDLEMRTSQVTEALDYQTATSDVLHAISRSFTDVQPVFDVIVENAARLCHAEFSAVAQFDGELLHLIAVSNMSPEETAAYRSVFPRPPNRSFIMGRAFIDDAPVHVEDVNDDPHYDPNTLAVLQRAASYRTYLGVPISRNGVPIGSIGLGRRRVEPFTEKQIALVQTFANQAVIAIENARLFAEIQEKNRLVEEQARELSKWNSTLESRVAEQVSQIGRMSKLTRFLSPKISNLIMSGEADDPLKTRRSEITVVYVDLRGFTAFTETSDPEEVMGVLREYHAELGRAITAHDGTIEHFAGDGAMILFNAPMPVDEHEMQAVRMCLQIRESVAALIMAWRKRGHELGIGAGIAGGYATIGTIGFEERLDFGAIGSVCNLAARLCGEARDGQILISPRVFAKTEGLVETVPVGELTLKGFHRPVAAYDVVGIGAGGGT